MNKNAIIQAVVGVAIAGALFALQSRVARLDADIRVLTAAKADEAGADRNDDTPIQLRKAAEIEAHLRPSLDAKDIPGFARALAEADEWLFDPTEEEQAGAVLRRKTEFLRDWIKEFVESLQKLAVTAEKGEIAAAHLREVNSVLGLYPQPADEAQQKELESIVSGITQTSRRVDELRRLRYNQWAIHRIEDGVRQFHENKSVGPDNVVTACVTALAYIDPAHLDPTVMDLYQYLVQITREKAGDAYFSRIAKGLTNPAVARLTPLDFDQ